MPILHALTACLYCMPVSHAYSTLHACTACLYRKSIPHTQTACLQHFRSSNNISPGLCVSFKPLSLGTVSKAVLIIHASDATSLSGASSASDARYRAAQAVTITPHRDWVLTHARTHSHMHARTLRTHSHTRTCRRAAISRARVSNLNRVRAPTIKKVVYLFNISEIGLHV